MFFVGGFYTNTFVASFDDNSSKSVRMVSQKIDAPKDLKFRGMPSVEEDLSTRVTNLYRYFDGEQFLNDINSKIDNMNLNDEFESSLEDNDSKKVRFILVENFNANGNDCKKVKFNEPLKLSSNDQGTDVSLDLCKINNNYEISSINLSK